MRSETFKWGLKSGICRKLFKGLMDIHIQGRERNLHGKATGEGMAAMTLTNATTKNGPNLRKSILVNFGDFLGIE